MARRRHHPTDLVPAGAPRQNWVNRPGPSAAILTPSPLAMVARPLPFSLIPVAPLTIQPLHRCCGTVSVEGEISPWTRTCNGLWGWTTPRWPNTNPSSAVCPIRSAMVAALATRERVFPETLSGPEHPSTDSLPRRIPPPLRLARRRSDQMKSHSSVASCAKNVSGRWRGSRRLQSWRAPSTPPPTSSWPTRSSPKSGRPWWF